jgi:hypothetical protein
MATIAADVEGQAVRPTSAKLTLSPLIALVIGSMVREVSSTCLPTCRRRPRRE